MARARNKDVAIAENKLVLMSMKGSLAVHCIRKKSLTFFKIQKHLTGICFLQNLKTSVSEFSPQISNTNFIYITDPGSK